MNIFGEGFPEEIINQIKYRQEIYGSGYDNSLRTNEQILYLNNNSSWCKLISGVDISSSAELNNPTIKSLGLSGNELAKKFVLFNGTSTESGELRAGINPENNILAEGYAYGIGGNNFGIRPMMGIEQASIKHENRGSLRRAEVKIKAFNRAQFEIIDILYIRLGFSVLLEWGNSIIIDNKGNIDTNPIGLSLADDFLKGTNSYDVFLQKIYNQRLAFGGNYDAMLAKVANFSWSLLPDGTYDITLYLSSIGDVIESLKVNVLTDSVSLNSENSTNDSPTSNSGNIIDNFSYQSTLGNFFYVCKTLIDKNNTSGKIKTYTLNPSDPILNNIITDTINNDPTFIKFKTSAFENDMDDIMSIQNNAPVTSYMSTIFNTGETNTRYYIRLGTLLKFLQEYIAASIYDNNKKTPLLFFDVDTNTNIMTILYDQVSCDPRVCFINRRLAFTDGVEWIFGPSNPKNSIWNTTLNSAIPDRSKYGYANIMNIYLEMGFVLNKIVELKDDKGNLSIIDFLKGLMFGINDALGGLNDFDVFIDETNNTVKVIDKNPLPNLSQVIDTLNANYPSSSFNNNKSLNKIPTTPTFNVFGYFPRKDENSKSTAGFIKEFSLTSQITPQFATMITVAAASQGAVVGENDTALSKLNKGLKDRYKPAIINSVNPVTPNTEEALSTLKEEYFRLWGPYKAFLKLLKDNKAEDADIETHKPTYSSIVQKGLELKKTEDFINNVKTTETYQGTGYIPFNLSLRLNGLAGIKINQQFTMDTSYLPSNYPDTMLFLIKNLSHEIKNNIWTTQIETYAIGKPDSTAKGSSTSGVTSNRTSNSSPGSRNSVINRDSCDIRTIPPSRIVSPSAISSVLLGAGYSKAAVAGVLGNIENESNFDLNAYNTAEGGCGAYGLVQWRGDRQTNLYNYANSIGSTFDTLRSQVSFIIKEVSGISGLRGYKNIQDPEKAAFEFASKFERFEDAENPNNPQNIARKRSARRFFNNL